MASSWSRSGADSLCTHFSSSSLDFAPFGLRIPDGHPADVSIGDTSLDSQHIAGHRWPQLVSGRRARRLAQNHCCADAEVYCTHWTIQSSQNTPYYFFVAVIDPGGEEGADSNPAVLSIPWYADSVSIGEHEVG